MVSVLGPHLYRHKLSCGVGIRIVFDLSITIKMPVIKFTHASRVSILVPAAVQLTRLQFIVTAYLLVIIISFSNYTQINNEEFIKTISMSEG